MTTRVRLKDIELKPYLSTGTNVAYAISVERIAAYSDKETFFIDFHVSCGDAPTLNINGLGAKNITVGGVNVSTGQLSAYSGYFIKYNLSLDKFAVIGGGAGGISTCADVKDCIENFTDLDLSNLTNLTLGGNIDFSPSTDIDRTNTNNTGEQNFDGDYTANYVGSTTNNTNTTTNNVNTVTNNEGTINNFNEDSVNNYEGDIYVGGDIIQTTNDTQNGGTVTQSGTGQAYTDLNNVLLCDLAIATATPIDPTLKDYIKLIVGGIEAGNNLGQGITGGNPAIYGNGSELRGNVLTPAIVNNANFGVAFKFGDSKTIQVLDFGFNVPLTNTILGVKVEVIFNSTADTVNVDCITMVVYHTDGSTIRGGGGSGLYNVASDSDDFTGDGNEDTWILPSTPLDSNVLHLTTDSGTNLILGIDYLLVGDTITFINIIPLGETIYARWILGNPPVTPVTVNTNIHNAVSGEYIVVTYAAGNTTINLPEAAISNGSVVKVKKFTGEDIRVITIIPYGADLIDGYTGATMNIDRTMYTFTCVDGAWYLGD